MQLLFSYTEDQQKVKDVIKMASFIEFKDVKKIYRMGAVSYTHLTLPTKA